MKPALASVELAHPLAQAMDAAQCLAGAQLAATEAARFADQVDTEARFPHEPLRSCASRSCWVPWCLSPLAEAARRWKPSPLFAAFLVAPARRRG